MPFVHITISNARADRARAIADGVHDALVEALGIPSGDRFQKITRQALEDMIFDHAYLDVDRRDVVYVEISLVSGRSEEKKRTLYRAIASNLWKRACVRPEDIFVILSENSRADWSAGNGQAQLLELQVAPIASPAVAIE